MTLSTGRCWICGSDRLEVAKPSDLDRGLDSDSFAITDSHYGRTAEIQRCEGCSFLQCTELGEVLAYYEGLEDPAYEEGRSQRALQMKALLRRIQRVRPGGRLLDVGAGSGILVEQAAKLGYRAEGIEPSRWLQREAAAQGLPVVRGTLPHPELTGPYEVVTLIDVIEHVSDPVQILERIRAVVAPDGLVAVVTPDVRSCMARLLGWRWWHYRVAHIGYFNRETLQLAFELANLDLVALQRPTWYFGADYLAERVNSYLPGSLRLPVPRLLERITVPLNLWDSFFALGRPKGPGA